MNSIAETVKRLAFKSHFLTDAFRRLRVLLHYVARQPHEADFNFLCHPAFSKGLLLDLGGNIGQSALSVAKVQPGLQVVSIEANPACESGLAMTRLLLGPSYRYELIGVGDRAGTLAFHVPVRSSRLLLEEGTFAPLSLASPASVARLGQQGRDYTIKQIDVRIVTVDSLALRPRVVKMDLQGLEMAALLGMRSTLVACRPALMVEVGEQQADVTAWLAALGYSPFFWDGTALQPGSRPGQLNAMYLMSDDPALA
jgi:FkbM family methyltransferase